MGCVISEELVPELAVIKQLLPGLVRMFGDASEAVLHDYTDPENSLVAIEGTLTGRKVGAPLTDRLLQVYQTQGDQAEDLVNIRTRAADGRLLNSTTIFIRNSEGKIVGSLGINVDISDLELGFNALRRILGLTSQESGEERTIHFAANVDELMSDLINKALMKVGPVPQAFNRDDRLKVVQTLYEQGLFKIKGSVDYLAKRLGVSPFTIYSYLDTIRDQRGDTINGDVVE